MDTNAFVKNDWYSDTGAVSILVLTLLAFLVPMVYVYPPFPPRQSDALLETHYRLGLEPSESRLGTQFQPEHGPKPGSPASIQSLWIYPVKSCRGIELSRSRVLPSGLEFDRLFTFAQLKSPFPVGLASSEEEKGSHRWEFITQRQFPRLATVQVEVWRPDLAKCQRRGVKSNEDFIILRFPWQETGWSGALSWLAAKALRGRHAQPEKEVLLPVEFPGKDEVEEKGYTYESVKIWRDTVTALNMEAELPLELRLYLGVSNRLALFRIDPNQLRKVYRCAPREESAGYQPVTGFQDAYPLHLLNISSVQDLENKLKTDKNLKHLDARRFRGNIILTGAPAYEEETWKSIRFEPTAFSALEAANFHVSCRTVRCKLPNVDPDTGLRHAVEPDKSLRTYRNVDEGAPLGGCLGMQLTPLFKKSSGHVQDLETTIEVGMALSVLETGSHRYIYQ